MASGFPPRNQKLAVSFLLSCLYSVMVRLASSTLILHGLNVSLSLEDVRANFAPPVESTGICGKLYLADPLDACSSLRNKIGTVGNSTAPFVLTIRGNCIFEDKVRVAQRAGFKAVIVYDNEDDDPLVTMAGNPNGIKIHAVFVSKASGEKLSNYIGSELVDVCLVGGFENSAWSIMAISFISLLSISAVLGICFFVRRLHVRRERPPARVREFHGMSGRLVKTMPSLVFTSALDDNCTSATCAICLEDYKVGEKIRILPCKHKFHAICVDCWLTTWRTFCPVCKHDARTTSGVPTASESTPLLHSNPSSAASSPVSGRSSYLSTSARQIAASPSQRSYPSSSINYSLSHSSRLPQPIQLRHSPSASMISASRSSMDLQSIPRSIAQMGSPNSYSYGYPSISPLNSQYLMSSYSPSHASSSYLVGYSSHQQTLLHHSASVVSLSHYDSAHSLPGFDARSER